MCVCVCVLYQVHFLIKLWSEPPRCTHKPIFRLEIELQYQRYYQTLNSLSDSKKINSQNIFHLLSASLRWRSLGHGLGFGCWAPLQTQKWFKTQSDLLRSKRSLISEIFVQYLCQSCNITVYHSMSTHSVHTQTYIYVIFGILYSFMLYCIVFIGYVASTFCVLSTIFS